MKYNRQNEENLYGKALTSTYKGFNCTGKGFVKIVNLRSLKLIQWKFGLKKHPCSL